MDAVDWLRARIDIVGRALNLCSSGLRSRKLDARVDSILEYRLTRPTGYGHDSPGQRVETSRFDRRPPSAVDYLINPLLVYHTDIESR